MLIIHSVQKLLNTSRLEGSLYITQPNENQLLHSWYARLLASGFPGKIAQSLYKMIIEIVYYRLTPFISTISSYRMDRI